MICAAAPTSSVRRTTGMFNWWAISCTWCRNSTTVSFSVIGLWIGGRYVITVFVGEPQASDTIILQPVKRGTTWSLLYVYRASFHSINFFFPTSPADLGITVFSFNNVIGCFLGLTSRCSKFLFVVTIVLFPDRGISTATLWWKDPSYISW